MKRTILPILLILLAVAVLAAVTYWYEHHWGIHGPFPHEHHH